MVTWNKQNGNLDKLPKDGSHTHTQRHKVSTKGYFEDWCSLTMQLG
jgi:hypothetical protein